MPNRPLSITDRLALVETLTKLPDPQFKMLVFALNPPAGILPSDLAALGDRAFVLLQWAEGIGPGLLALQDTLAQILGKPLVVTTTKLADLDWSTVFGSFSPYDFGDIHRAFLGAFRDCYHHDFWTIRPDNPPLTGFDQMQDLLKVFDDPALAVRFLERAIAALQVSPEAAGRDFTPLKQNCDRLAQQHRIPLIAPVAENQSVRQGYLLVALKESGRVTTAGPSVTVFTELQVTGARDPIEFGVMPVTCPFDQVAGYLSDWIYQAEEALDAYDCDREEVILELFLPCAYLEEALADWDMKTEQDDPISLGMHRSFVIRSLERASNRRAQRALKRKWQLLEACVKAKTACTEFHRQDHCPEQRGALRTLLEDVPGLTLMAQLPPERDQRQALLYEIVNAAVPIALWSTGCWPTEVDSDTVADLKATFDDLLQGSPLTNFAVLAQRWRKKRAQADTETIKHIRLLCDCPERWPSLPDPNRDEDLLVAL